MRTVSPTCMIQDINYNYDGVGNIVSTNQYNSACNTLGGPYAIDYKYDQQNRLIEAISSSSGAFYYDFLQNIPLPDDFGVIFVVILTEWQMKIRSMGMTMKISPISHE